MQAELIVMLTHNDVTVPDAKALFDTCQDLPVRFWGFKDVGITAAATRDLVATMKAAGKTTFLEVVTYTEAECLESAQLAIDAGFDYLTGTRYYPSVAALLEGTGIEYFPFVGNVGGSPVTLSGSIEDVLADAARLEAAGVSGLDLVAWRLADGDPVDLARRLVAVASRPVIIAGSIASVERIGIVNDINPFAFTMGGALFDAKFVPGGDFRENLGAVISAMAEIE